MKHTMTAVVFATLIPFSSLSWAQQPPHQPPMGGGMMGMEHGMDKMDPAKMTEHLKLKQEQMLLMHDLSNKILAEKDPQRQQALKDQQLELMKAHHMEMMRMHQGGQGQPMNHEKKQ